MTADQMMDSAILLLTNLGVFPILQVVVVVIVAGVFIGIVRRMA